MFRALFFLALDFLPLSPDGVDVVRVGVSKNMRVAADELVGDRPGRLLKIKRLPFLRKLAVKDHLQQQIAAFLEHFVVVLGFDRIDQFIHLLYGVKADGLVILLTVPRATAGATKPGHHLDQFVDRWFAFFGFAFGGHVRG